MSIFLDFIDISAKRVDAIDTSRVESSFGEEEGSGRTHGGRARLKRRARVFAEVPLAGLSSRLAG